MVFAIGFFVATHFSLIILAQHYPTAH